MDACGLCRTVQSPNVRSSHHETCHDTIISEPTLFQDVIAEERCHPQVDFSHKAGAPLASEAHPVRLHVATDLAQEGLSAGDGGRWDVRSEVFNYEERMEWKKELGAMPARRYRPRNLQSISIQSPCERSSHLEA